MTVSSSALSCYIHGCQPSASFPLSPQMVFEWFISLSNISLPASRLTFSFATSSILGLNLVVYYFLRELPVLPPSMGNSVAKF
jgi:hypothetical protein